MDSPVVDLFQDLRNQMVDRLVVPYGIHDQQVLEAMRQTPRHVFLRGLAQREAYADRALPIGHSQTISQPYMVARMTELAELSSADRVLEIGTGSGYQTAILARLAGQVYSLERIPDLAQDAAELLESLGFNNVTTKVFDGTSGWSEHRPFNAILVTAGAPSIPDILVDQLVLEGRLIIPVGDLRYQRLKRLIKKEHGNRIEDHGGCVFVKLIGQYGWNTEQN